MKYLAIAALWIPIAIFAILDFSGGSKHHSAGHHRLSSGDYKDLKNAYEGWQAGFAGLVNGQVSVNDMQLDTTYALMNTPGRKPGGLCGTKLDTYRALLNRYKDAVYAGAPYGPPAYATVAQSEARVEETCKPLCSWNAATQRASHPASRA